jgi:hypothetical protein
MVANQSPADAPSVSPWRTSLPQLVWFASLGLGLSAGLSCSDEAVRDGSQPPAASAAGQPSTDDPNAGSGAAASDAGARSDSSAGNGSGPVGTGGSSPDEPSDGLDEAGTGQSMAAGGQPDPGPVHGSATLGSDCDVSADCEPGLACLAAGSQVLGERSPPHGLCTKLCTDSSDCTTADAGALCFPLGPDSDQGYCVEGCAFGAAAGGAPKCHGRRDFACLPAYFLPSNQACLTTADCAPGDLCSDGTCAVTLPACLPSCRGDLDCPSGSYCDQSFLSGTCTTQKPTGKGLGEPCTIPAAGEGTEPDDCLGYCQSDGSGVTGYCASTCGLLDGCAWNTATEQFDGLCLYPSVLTVDVGGPGDFGFCTPTCNCSAECLDAALACVDPGGALGDAFSAGGLCFAQDDDATPYEQCAP